MSGNISAIRPGEVDVELANRAARRIREYLATHPDDKPIEVHVEVGNDDALVVPRAAPVMLAQVLGYLATGQGGQIRPDNAILTTQHASDQPNLSRPDLIE